MREAFRQFAEARGKLSPEDPAVKSVRRELLAEISNITQQYDLYFKKDVEVTAAMREECLVPTADQRWLMRQLSTIDRQLEHKIRLLMTMKRGGNGDPQSAETDSPEEEESSAEEEAEPVTQAPRQENV